MVRPNRVKRCRACVHSQARRHANAQRLKQRLELLKGDQAGRRIHTHHLVLLVKKPRLLALPTLLDQLRQVVGPIAARHTTGIDQVRQIVFRVRQNEIRVSHGVV
jgi:hypothetical protein